ncbi:sugar phosphate isomerase/epimerase family protein [Fimbriimonas ginsengisoli]|uniref:Xylose isomerase domain protein TIM barrel n=1 Tax=Fimbriimonas ginsengisoli Gsoil 348 TaxID=661478 RepID=A0A068NN26_FIMGI|nr:sugar phosphate isomerase/epimerase [Fimbriimonas ginsengisoli]AIE84866.1 Xylose isomerase domain protein TIM barrel [Fimbriimonas ginsengisoli Gsoil 348]
MLITRTGGFPIGFRRGWSDWQKDLDGMIAWAKANDLGVVDLGGDSDQIGGKVAGAGLRIGSADLPAWSGLITADTAKREEAVAKQAAYVEACAKHGIRNYFLVMLPDDASKPRSENFALMVEGLNLLTPHLEKHGGRLVIEGWPGPGALCCTPEGYRGVIREVASKSVGINYDPSHLLRMGIDPIRFLGEFAERVYHVHGKDTEVFPEGQYEYGTEQPATFAKGHGFGAHHWRYTIPGHGETRWTKAFEILKGAGYDGAVSIELEDENFNGSEAGEKQGILAGAHFLASC